MPALRSRIDRAGLRVPPAVLAVLVVGTLASAGAAGYLGHVQGRDTDERFDRRSAETVRALTDGLEGSGDTLRGVRGLFDGSASVTAGEFADFVRALDVSDQYPGVVAVSYVTADAARTVRYTAAARPLPERVPESGRVLHAAQDRARDTGEAVATPALRRTRDSAPVFYVFLPVYAHGARPATVEARRAALTGWVANTYRGPDFVAGGLARTTAVEVALYQGTTADPGALVGASAHYPGEHSRGLAHESRLTIFGTPWLVRTVAPPGFTPASYVVAPWLLLGGGLALSLLAALLVWSGRTARRRAERMVEDTTRTLRRSEERFRALADHSPAGVFFADETGTLAYANPRLLNICGVESFEGSDPRALVHPDDRARLTASWDKALAERAVFSGTYRLNRPDGTVRWVDIASGPTHDDGDALTGWVGMASDVTDSVEAKRRTDRLTRILEHTTDLVTLTDADGAVVWANEAARAFMRSVGTVPHRLSDLVAPSARTYFDEVVVPALREHGVWNGELSLLAPDGREVPVSQLIQAHYGSDGSVQNYSFSARDLSERQDYQSRLAHEVLHDRLTGLPNRVLFVDRLTQSLARTARRESLIAVLFVDLDRFKLVNDSMGHEAGDRLLTEVSTRLESVLRSGDTAARFGGDEYTLLCEEVVDEAQATAIAERVLSVLSVPFVLDGSPVHLTASVGIALCDGSPTVRPEDLLRDADAALHRAKDLGKARYELFDERLRVRAMARFQTESALHEAIAEGQLRVYYQPEVSLRTGKVIGAEALVRWLQPGVGLVSPDDFVPLAEETGLIGQIGAWVLREACWEAARWRDRREDGKPFEVWVNLSPRQLTGDIVAEVSGVLDETGIDPAQLGLEVTESALLGDVDAAIEVLTQLRALGVRIVIDDFGTGYSSLAYLRRLPVNGVKIDRSFVAGLDSPEDTAIVAAVVGMARALGLTTIAEGVETRAQLDEVIRLGCDAAQGFYFAKPAPRQTVDALLAQRPEWPGLTVPAPREVTALDPARRRLRGGA
jgi:diguanylate cyclase (GGDEF)-like protein/PAS domain S-box-containing protein